MIKLKLKKALSYTGIVSANQKDPYAEVKTWEEAERAKSTGYFYVDEDDQEEPDDQEPEDDNDNEDSDDEDADDEKYTQASLKKLNAEEQKEVIITLGGDPEETNNAEERIALILQLQDEQQEAGE